jgi:general secretion pathway protein K
MVLGAIAVLTVMLAEFQEDTSAELSSALAARDAVQAEYFARSAVNLSRLLIAAEPTIRQAITPLFALMQKKVPQLPVWEFSDRLLGAFNDEQAAQDFAGMSGLDLSLGKNLGLKGGRFEVVIVDEDSKIDVNMGASNDIAHIRLAKQLMGSMMKGGPLYNPLFEQKDSQGNFHDRFQICSAIIDWADVDEQAFNCDLTQSTSTGSAVEDAWYQLLPKPYRRKNAPYDSLEELHMVRGVGDDFWTTFVDPDPTNPKKREMTVWGQGAVNINTANAATLYALICSGVSPQEPLCTDPLQMQAFITAVTMAQAITMGAPLFGSPKDFVDMVQGQGPLGFIFSGGQQGGGQQGGGQQGGGQGAQSAQGAGGIPGLGGLGGALGLQKVKLLSPSDFAKGLTIESKIFSIYAVGVVKGYKRETRTSIHAVVDFRPAPVLGQQPGAPGSSGSPGGTTPAPSQPNTGGSGQTVPVSNDPNAIAAALQPNTGGQIIYYTIE